jgi:hypothetical protein
VYRRIEVLKILQKNAPSDDLQNINAIIAAYTDGRLKVEEGLAARNNEAVIRPTGKR